MNDDKTYTGIDIDSKINEAEAYRSMGLFMESLDVYEKILSKLDKSNPAKRDGIMENIDRLKEEIAGQETVYEKTASPEDILHFKKTVSKHESVTAILGSASAWKELGLYGEAAEEYKKLFSLDCHPGEIASEMVQCLLKLQSPSKALEQVERAWPVPRR